MATFRDASIGVWCLSWHPATDDVRFEALATVLRYNRLAPPGEHKAVLMLAGHHPGDVMALHESILDEHHGLDAEQACRSYRLHRALGLAPAYFPVCIESAERWQWMMAD